MAIADDLVFVSSGYGVGSKLFRISAGEEGDYRSETVWESRGLRTKFTNTVLHEGSLYGLDEGILVCLDPETGLRRWKRGRYGHGQLILVGDLLLITSEQGEVALVEANPERFQEVAPLSGHRGKYLEHAGPQRRPSAGPEPPGSRCLPAAFGAVTGPIRSPHFWAGAACLKQNLFHSRMIRPVVGGGGWTYLKQTWVRLTQNRFKRLKKKGLERN